MHFFTKHFNHLIRNNLFSKNKRCWWCPPSNGPKMSRPRTGKGRLRGSAGVPWHVNSPWHAGRVRRIHPAHCGELKSGEKHKMFIYISGQLYPREAHFYRTSTDKTEKIFSFLGCAKNRMAHNFLGDSETQLGIEGPNQSLCCCHLEIVITRPKLFF